MTTRAQAFTDRYATAWNDHDDAALRAQYTDDSVETSPLGTLPGVDAIVADAVDMPSVSRPRRRRLAGH